MKKIQIKGKSIASESPTYAVHNEYFNVQVLGVDDPIPLTGNTTLNIPFGPPTPNMIKTDTVFNYPNGDKMRVYKVIGSYYMDGTVQGLNVTSYIGRIVTNGSNVGVFNYKFTGSVSCLDSVNNTYTSPLSQNNALITAEDGSGNYLWLVNISNAFVVTTNPSTNTFDLYLRLWSAMIEYPKAIVYYEYEILANDLDTVTFS